ncbi:unnamed protein product [Tilletia laevis]|uniref:Ima1 N-terminal domain-containing protein n=1 Tax=Tilletia laevis TaxID=157183 RepID=A0A9N8QB68_9BASI|nr:unnamed protein product [Tilletia caries]CAD6908457.1 unnamed protein product [Tilletia laevis]CAD6912591.1 unnamed protein product [Tilletia laevis]
MSVLQRWTNADAGPSTAKDVRRRKASRRSGSGPYPAATCHFCQSVSRLIPPFLNDDTSTDIVYDSPISHGNLDAWLCSACQCYNRTHAHEQGGMTSWEPAMNQPSMNEGSFARRGVPPPSALMTQQQQDLHPFCHTCLTNQALLMNMLANYLPHEEDPTYQTALSSLPTYRASLLTRYPPVCEGCTPAVQTRLLHANNLAKQEAMRHFLARSRARSDAAVGKGKVITRPKSHTINLLTSSRTISLAFVSLLWTAWNPRWRRVRELRRRGSDVRIVGQRKWAQAHVVLWIARLVFLASCWLTAHPQHIPSIFLPAQVKVDAEDVLRWTCIIFVTFQVLVHIYAARVLQLQYGRKISWRTQESSHPTVLSLNQMNGGNAADQHAFDTALNLKNGSGGLGVGLQRASSTRSGGGAGGGGGMDDLFRRNDTNVDDDDDDDDNDEEEEKRGLAPGGADAMDWTPTTTTTTTTTTTAEAGQSTSKNAFAPWASASTSTNADTSAGLHLGPQRFFVPEQPTGLEDLLLDALRLREDEEEQQHQHQHRHQHQQGVRQGGQGPSSGWGRWWRR